MRPATQLSPNISAPTFESQINIEFSACRSTSMPMKFGATMRRRSGPPMAPQASTAQARILAPCSACRALRPPPPTALGPLPPEALVLLQETVGFGQTGLTCACIRACVSTRLCILCSSMRRHRQHLVTPWLAYPCFASVCLTLSQLLLRSCAGAPAGATHAVSDTNAHRSPLRQWRERHVRGLDTLLLHLWLLRHGLRLLLQLLLLRLKKCVVSPMAEPAMLAAVRLRTMASRPFHSATVTAAIRAFPSLYVCFC